MIATPLTLAYVLLSGLTAGVASGFAFGPLPGFTVGATPIDVGRTPRALLSAASCTGCHTGEGHEWAASRHAAAWTNGIFQREYRERKQAWCRNCHAPLAAQQADLAQGDRALAAEGVSCAVCHVRDGKIHAASRRPGSPHGTVVVAGFGGPRYCGGCHQFNFPVLGAGGALVRYTAHPMQNTVAEFLGGPFADRKGGCRSCHASSEFEHRYPGAHDPSMLDRALDLTLCRLPDGAVRVTLANVGAGHNVPTGDVHRHILVRLWRSSAPERVWEAFFGRRFEPLDDGGKRTIWDSTIAPGKSRTFTVRPAELQGEEGEAAEPLNAELRYVYTLDEHPRRGRDPGEPTSRVVDARRVAPADLPACRAKEER